MFRAENPKMHGIHTYLELHDDSDALKMLNVINTSHKTLVTLKILYMSTYYDRAVQCTCICDQVC